MSYPKEKRRFDHGGFVVFADARVLAELRRKSQAPSWRCPNCGGDCFGTSMGVRYCHGHSYGTPTEQSAGCGYWEDDLGHRDVR